MRITEQEYRTRLANLQSQVAAHDLDAFLISSKDALQANMVISHEPGIYLQGVGGVRHSDTILVTEDGYENLTRYPTDLDSLIVKGMKLFTQLRGALVRRAVGIK